MEQSSVRGPGIPDRDRDVVELEELEARHDELRAELGAVEAPVDPES
jgi:hypothetical protein